MTEILEDGDIYLLYRPRVDDPRVESFDEVQRLLVVLHPWRGRRRLRLMVVGRKRLPEIDEHDRFWAFVDEVVDRPEQLRDALDGRAYPTRTRGERHQVPARPVAEGAYAIPRHDDHTHLAYQLEHPHRTGAEQSCPRATTRVRETPARPPRLWQRGRHDDGHHHRFRPHGPEHRNPPPRWRQRGADPRP